MLVGCHESGTEPEPKLKDYHSWVLRTHQPLPHHEEQKPKVYSPKTPKESMVKNMDGGVVVQKKMKNLNVEWIVRGTDDKRMSALRNIDPCAPYHFLTTPQHQPQSNTKTLPSLSQQTISDISKPTTNALLFVLHVLFACVVAIDRVIQLYQDG
eukprot:2443564-Amphidinium_carterae.1